MHPTRHVTQRHGHRIPVVRDQGADVCPSCHASLGTQRGRTRRLAVLTPERGVFVWQCPECSALWQSARPGQSPVVRSVPG